MKFIGYKCEFNGKINGIHILINEKLNWEIPDFFKNRYIPGQNRTGMQRIKS